MDFSLAERVLAKYLGPGASASRENRLLTDNEKLALYQRALRDPETMQRAVQHLGEDGVRSWSIAMERLRQRQGVG